MSASPQPTERASGAPAALPPPTPLPSFRGLGPLLVGTVGLGLMAVNVQMDFRGVFMHGIKSLSSYGIESLFTLGIEAVFLVAFAALAVMVLVGAVRLLGSMAHRARASRHPHEPWLWDYPWRREMVDPRLSLSRLLLTLPGYLLFTTLTLAICGAPLVAAFWMAETGGRIVFGIITLLFCAPLLPRLWKSLGPYLRRWAVVLRCGRMCLRLPGIPLVLGTRPEVELAFGRDVPQLTRARVTLRRVSERRLKAPTEFVARTTVRNVEDERAYDVTTEAPGPRQGLFIPLELPPPEVAASTWMEDGLHIFWEVQLTADVEDMELDTTFRLPVYLVPAADAVAA